MKRWIAIAALAAVLGTSAPALADFPVTTQSGQSNTGRNRPLLGRGGVLFPWLEGNAANNSMSRPRGKKTSYGKVTSRLNAQGTRDATNVIPSMSSARR